MTARVSPHVLRVAAAAPLMSGFELGRRIYANNDDARFAVLAQDVVSHGLRLFPDINGVPYYNKPALLAWLIALVSWPSGAVSQLTAALPSAVAAVGLAFVVLALGRDMFGADAGTYHWEVGRFNVANDYPRVSERMKPALREASVVATWDLPELPFSFYFNRRVVGVTTSADLDRVMSEEPAVAIMTESALAGREDREQLQVLVRDRLALRSISLVRKDIAKHL